MSAEPQTPEPGDLEPGENLPALSDQSLSLASSPGVVVSDKGWPIWCAATAIAIMSHHPDWQGILRRDLFANRNLLLKPIPGSTDPEAFVSREVSDTDYTQALVWFNRNGFPNATKAVVVDAFTNVAWEMAFDPVWDYLDGLEWDGRSRLTAWLTTYLGVEETAYSNEVGLRWMIAAVARAFEPGCQVDTCLVLEGSQGGGKSSALRVLAGPAWFGDALPDLKSKDASSYLSGKWIIEIAELTSFKSNNAEMIKAFVTRREEQYRPAYGRNEIRERRRCVFAGTTNRDDYLLDPTGNRRFLPVVTGEVDLEALKADRDQLWAEAVTRYRSGEAWWLTGEAAKLAAEEQESRGDDDPWTSQIVEFCEGKEMVACKVILEEVFCIPSDRQTRKESSRVGDLLRHLGYQRDGKFTSGPARGCARFVRPLP